MVNTKPLKKLLKQAKNWRLRWAFGFRVEILVEEKDGELLVETDFEDRFYLDLPVGLCTDLAVRIVKQHCLHEVELWVEGERVNLRELVGDDDCEWA